MEISKLPSGKWFVQACFTVNGKRYRPSYTGNTKGECQYWLAEQKLKYKSFKPCEMTVGQAMDKYIALCQTLSPTTKEMYEITRKYAFRNIIDTPVDELTDETMQVAINEESLRGVNSYKSYKQISAKTVINEYGLLSSALKVVCNKTYNVRLPKKTKKLRTYPHPKDIIPIIQGTELEIPCLMAMFLSLRMSETRGAKYSSIRDGYLYVEQVKVNVNGIDIVKEATKTFKSTRRVKIPKYLLDLIMANKTDDEYIVTLNENQISKRFKRLMDKNGYDLTYHGLRHMFASCGAMIGCSPLYLADIGGWESGTQTLEKVYQEVIGSERDKADELMSNYFDSLFH